MSEFIESLQPASFRGVPFGVSLAESRHGRRLAVHEYPKRDKPWAEDLGRSTRPFIITGFLITDSMVYGGGPVASQYKALAGAAETEGTGTLVHPILGNLEVSIPDGGLAIAARWDNGRVVEFTMACIETGERQFPSDAADTAGETDAAADEADSAAESDFFDDVVGALLDGASILNMAARTASAWIDIVLMGAADATSLFNSLVELPGDFGRYFPGRTTGYASPPQQPASDATVDSLIAQGTADRGAVQAASDVLIAACAGVDTAAIAAAARATAAALLASTANPADAVRILTGCCSFYPTLPTSPSVTGLAESVMQLAMAALLRRCTFTALARATALYQPSSADDAADLRSNMAALFQGEIDIAGDRPDDASFVALGTLRAAIIKDLDTRGAGLPQLMTVKSAMPVPACVIAQRLYQDAGRTDELITEANAVHPAFMPLSFKALVK